ncbi:hypothetical protein COTS27_00065 [Spirochaetota bacterium]|nr:hypothetical protein COTS27_00065 [Spirochaetota bacterium]
MNTSLKKERLPFFPLNIAVLPSEKLELYIFEERYAELVHQCEENDHGFGIIPILGEKLLPYGTEVEVLKVKRSLKGGTSRITVCGKRIFQLFSFETRMDGLHLYSGGDVVFRNDKLTASSVASDRNEIIANSVHKVDPQLNNDVKWDDFDEAQATSVERHSGLRLQKQVNVMFIEICDLIKKKGGFAYFDHEYFSLANKSLLGSPLKINGKLDDSYAIAAQMGNFNLRERARLIAMDKEEYRLKFIYKRMKTLLTALKNVTGKTS